MHDGPATRVDEVSSLSFGHSVCRGCLASRMQSKQVQLTPVSVGGGERQVGAKRYSDPRSSEIHATRRNPGHQKPSPQASYFSALYIWIGLIPNRIHNKLEDATVRAAAGHFLFIISG